VIIFCSAWYYPGSRLCVGRRTEATFEKLTHAKQLDRSSFYTTSYSYLLRSTIYTSRVRSWLWPFWVIVARSWILVRFSGVLSLGVVGSPQATEVAYLTKFLY